MAFDFSGLSSLINAVGSGASSIISATKGNVKTTTTNLGIVPASTGGNSSGSSLMGIAVVVGLFAVLMSVFRRKRRR